MSPGAHRGAAPRRMRVRALLASCHPGPTVAVTLLALVLGVVTRLPAERLVLLGLAVGAGQLSIGFANDWLDAERDARTGRSDKPVALGLVSARAVRTAAFVSLILAALLTAGLGWRAWAVHAVLVASGWAYDLVLKRTAWSLAPFCLAFGLLPALVTLAAPQPRGAAGWAIAVGAVLGVSVHFTNVLPDLDDDARTGVVGLPHRLGRVRAGVVAFAALLVAAVVAYAGSGGAHGPAPAAALGGLGASFVLAVAGIWHVLTRPPSRTLFRLVILAAFFVVAQLALAGARIASAPSL
ncbi:MAG: UbiA family prenyltransferase [Cellulomonadaceae bacterium]